MHWIKSKGMDEVCSVDIGDSLSAALALKEKLNKLSTKVDVSNFFICACVYDFLFSR